MPVRLLSNLDHVYTHSYDFFIQLQAEFPVNLPRHQDFSYESAKTETSLRQVKESVEWARGSALAFRGGITCRS